MSAVEMGGTKMSCMKWVGIMAAAGVFALGGGGAVCAKTVLQEDFRSAPTGGRDGQIVKSGGKFLWKGAGGNSTVERGGYRIYDIQGLNPAAGTVEMDITRAGSQESETLFSFGDQQGHQLLGLNIRWESPAHDGGTYGPMIVTSGMNAIFLQKALGDFGVPYRYNGLFLKRGVSKGQTFHFAFSWGPAGPKVFIDGKQLDAETDNEAELAAAVAKTRKFLIGGRISGPQRKDVWDTPSSLISNVQVHDVQLRVADLATPFTTGVAIDSVSHDAFKVAGFSGKLIAGNTVTVGVNGTPGAAASFDIAQYPDNSGTVALDWRGWGVYLEEKSSFESGEVDLSDVVRYNVYSSLKPFPAITAEMAPVATLEVGEQTYKVEGLEPDIPYYLAVVAEMRDGSFEKVIWPVAGLPAAEVGPGVYQGGFTATYADRIPRGVVVARLSRGEDVVTLASENLVVVDPALTVTVTSSEDVLKADEKSKALISVKVTDANGNAVQGRKIRFLLATTSQYTGVVGGGAFGEQVGGAMQESTWGETDFFGNLTATYVAGFAAKTAIIVARDMSSNSTGAAYIKTYIQASAQIELLPVDTSAAMAQGYQITVTSSDDWLTADGKSQARITAKVTLGGEPVKGHAVSFSLSSNNGSIRTVSGTTGADGVARAVYTAGKKIGLVLVTATDTTVDISGSVQIELRSDAPAKIAIKIDPEKIPADGRSRADITVTVTDINDNPNDNVEVEYAVTGGSGQIRDDKGMTNRRGESTNVFSAGRTAGTATISITVQSTVPTAEELVAARGMALAVPHYSFR